MSPRILIIEDSRTEALRAKLVLEREGFQVQLAGDGKDGLTKAASEKPDLILVDSIMPQMGGFEVCGKLKLDPLTAAIPVAVMGGKDEMVDLPSGANIPALLAKPYDPATLVSKVKQLFSNGAGGGQNPVGEIKQLQTQIAQLEHSAVDAKKTRSDLLANMSHELRTPLHEIIGMTDLVLGTDLNAEQLGYLNTVRSSSNALLSLISDVIEFSEIENGQLDLEQKEFDLAEPFERTAEVMGARATEKGIKFSTAFAPQVPRQVIGDANRLRQVLSALVANAIKFTEQGEIAVRVDVETAHDSEADLHFQVKDTGIGIAEDRREIIFEPFQQADVSATRRFGGMGMGLALAKQLVTLMGGRIWVESETGKGSVFHFIVKLKRQSQSAAAPSVVSGKPWPRSLQILVAEDSPTNQLIAKSSLKKAGHAVTLAVNGLEAVRAYETARGDSAGQAFELVLMDVSMPEMDGLDATRAIREKEKTLGGHVIIVAMTAFATREYHEKCLAAGMDGYVSKPVRIDELNKTLEPFFTRNEPVATEPPVNLRDALEIVGGDVDILREAAAMALAEIPEQIQLLQEAVARQDAKGVEAKAHRLKGLMGNLGGNGAGQVAQRLETMGERGDVSNGHTDLTTLQSEVARVSAFYADPAWEARARQVQEG